MKHALGLQMDASSAAVLRIVGLLNRHGLSIESLVVEREENPPAYNLYVELESDDTLDLLLLQLERFIAVWEVRRLPSGQSWRESKAAV